MNIRKLYKEQLEKERKDIDEICKLRVLALDLRNSMQSLLNDPNDINKLRAKNALLKVDAMIDSIQTHNLSTNPQ